MTKQEYEAKMIEEIDFGNQCGMSAVNMLHIVLFVKDQYIVSLEAENAKLEKLNSAALGRLSEHACPPYLLNYGQPCNDSDDCVACWREYLGGSDA